MRVKLLGPKIREYSMVQFRTNSEYDVNTLKTLWELGGNTLGTSKSQKSTVIQTFDKLGLIKSYICEGDNSQCCKFPNIYQSTNLEGKLGQQQCHDS